MKMSKRMKRALLWGLVGFTASFFLWQGVEESFSNGASFVELLKVAYGTPRYAIRGPIAAISFFLVSYFIRKE